MPKYNYEYIIRAYLIDLMKVIVVLADLESTNTQFGDVRSMKNV